MRARKPLLLISAIAMATVLTACGGDSVSVPDGNGGSVKVDNSGDGGVKIESEDGTVVGGTGSLPKGFPEGEVPVVDGDILSGVGVDTADQQGYNVVITPSGDDDLDAAVALLTAKGFTTEGTIDMGVSQTAQLKSDAWEVLVAYTVTEGDRSFSYTVVPVDS